MRPKAAAIPELEGTPIDGAAAVTVAATAAAAAAAGDGSSSSFKGMRGDVARSSGSVDTARSNSRTISAETGAPTPGRIGEPGGREPEALRR